MVNGFCNDIALDAAGNVYATDSWYPRILRLRAGAAATDALEERVNSSVFPADQWHLNGIDVDQATSTLYVVENHPGALYRIPIGTDGMPGTVTPITTSQPLGGPDGLKVIAPNLLATAENDGVSLIKVTGDMGMVTPVLGGFDGVATIALHQASVWIVENQAGRFWDRRRNERPRFGARPVRTPSVDDALGLLPANVTATTLLETWVTDPVFGTTQWHLNGIDVDATGENLYVVENHPGHLWRVAIQANGNAGMVTEIMTSRPLRGPDGLKVIGTTTLAVAEGSGMAIVELTGNTGTVRTINTGLDGIATFAMLQGSAWIPWVTLCYDGLRAVTIHVAAGNVTPDGP